MRVDLRLHAVINHAAHLAVAGQDGVEIRQMSRKSKRVKAQIMLGDGLIGPCDICAQHPVIVFNILDHGAHAHEFRMLCKSR